MTTPSIMQRRSLLVAVACGPAVALAAEKGYLGFAVSVEGEGFFLNPTLKSVKVAKVVPGSPAEKAGISAGDTIVEIEGRAVLGAKANDLKPYMEREVGQTVRLGVKKPSGQVDQVTLVAGRKSD